MQINFTEFTKDEIGQLVDLICGERWDYHSTPEPKREKILESFESGYYNGQGKRTFWIIEDGKKTGFMRLFDLGDDKLDDETPMFDIRITKSSRGKGIGELALKWLADFVFTNYPRKNRFEATTRADNAAMRRVFEKCGFIKEAHYRQAWPDNEGNLHDCAGYALLRCDWKDKTKTPVAWEK